MATVKQIQSWVKELFDNGDQKRTYEVDKSSNTIVTKMSLRNKLKSTRIRIVSHEVYISVRAYQ